MVKISFIMITARENFPFDNELHVFQPTLESFKNQTMFDFEWVIVDCLYEERKDFFLKKKFKFRVKHVPASPNLWNDKGFPGIAEQYNRGIIHADGELLFFTGDSYLAPPHFMKVLWDKYEEGYFPLAWYMRDYGKQKMVPGPDGNSKLEHSVKSPVKYEMSGLKGENVAIEHRYYTAFAAGRIEYDAPWEWYFGCSSASMDAMLKINGFDQRFDGDYTLLDCDVGSRLEMAGYNNFLMYKPLFLVRYPSDVTYWNKNIKKAKMLVKCNYPLIWLNRNQSRMRINRFILTEDDVDWMKYDYCATKCHLREDCEENHKEQFPFEYKPNHDFFVFWYENQRIFDLRDERGARINGEEYVEGVYI